MKVLLHPVLSLFRLCVSLQKQVLCGGYLFSDIYIHFIKRYN